MDIKDINATSLPVAPSFGSSAEFDASINLFTFGNNHTQRIPRHINSLGMKLSLSFNQLTNSEANQTVNFLQKNFYSEVQTYNNAGYFSNKRIEPFYYLPFYPYKTNQFFCMGLNHTKQSFNIHNISAELLCASPSILNNVEQQGVEFNENIAGRLSHLPSVTAGFRSFSSTVTDNDIQMKKGQRLFANNNYGSLVLNEDVSSAVGSVTFDATVDANDFGGGQITFQNTSKRNSMFLQDPNDCSYYPYAPTYGTDKLDVRMFDFRPTESIGLSYSPKYRSMSDDLMYSKLNQYGFNPNLTNLSLTFEGRSDIEAKNILFFLESHLGYKKFGFSVLGDYINNESTTSKIYSPNRQRVSTFVCPNWSHTYVYRNNHTITASFIESLNY